MNRNQNVGKFEDLTITQTEFHMQIKNHLANVKNRYKNEQITGSLAENKKAIEELQTASWERAIWDKAIFFIAKKEGIGDFTSYAEIVNTMADENKQREEKISKGEIVYGLSRFGLNEFYGHLLAETKTSLIKKLSQKNGPLFCSDQDVYTRFQTNKGSIILKISLLKIIHLKRPNFMRLNLLLIGSTIGIMNQENTMKQVNFMKAGSNFGSEIEICIVEMSK
ncbi:hypothetical protein N8A33_001032 [Enterococcus hirae]|nr:hypothetical protein [Enterococcus hirae]EMF0531846.1 hypothetical protein [Enterococcus hirae]